MDKDKSTRFMLKVVGDVATAMAAGLLLVGDRAGLFKQMAGAGPLGASELAERAGVRVRYVEEWLAAMAGAGYVEYDATSDRFTLPDEHAQFLTDPGSEYYLGGLFGSLPGLLAMAPKLAQAFQTGSGISFADFGSELPQMLEVMNRPVYEARLVQHWLPAMPEVMSRLQAGGRALDVGCGTGVVPITLAKAFPTATVAGIDLDAHSIDIAQGYARDAGLAERVHFAAQPIEHLTAQPRWDLITTFDVMHDLPDPVGAMKRMRAALNDGGTYLMVEPKVADDLETNLGNPFARMFYGISCLHCVPQSLAQGGLGLGACWGEKRARALAAEAGFTRFERLGIRTAGLVFYALGQEPAEAA
ncbi:class I SAM-dependent methyltransferase [Aquabacterium sp.]|uniref:class I SAM-dependent methyltransferase n=1 Tax=Aquabacterium sp. TaxID=1872578 RepID=UPI002C31FB28|nr:class I SAM-dependent methyltransferase [Aquabacterium sp.]HSW03042.1 class I SAM-dependent methyltransferase [Aquabacterium sp.]